jgi:protein TonB
VAPAPAPATPAAAAVAGPLLPPRPISGLASNAKPAYPVAARSRHQQGRVVLRVEVSADGLPLRVTVASSSNHPALDEAALAAVKRWRFSPATRGGVPVAGTAEIPVEFRLEE